MSGIDDLIQSRLSPTVPCTCCKGSGKITLTSEEYGKPETKRTTLMMCFDCSGSGQMTVEQVKARERQLALWCKCGNPSGEVTFHDDNTRRVCSKHHYTCCDCGKITQVG